MQTRVFVIESTLDLFFVKISHKPIENFEIRANEWLGEEQQQKLIHIQGYTTLVPRLYDRKERDFYELEFLHLNPSSAI